MTKGKPYVGLVATRVAAVVVAKVPLLALSFERRLDRSVLACLAVTSHQLRYWQRIARLCRAFFPHRQLTFARNEKRYSSLPAAEAVRIDSTTVASARVVVSPRGCPLAISRSRRRMILPERVLGSSGVNMIVLGRAIDPIFETTCSRSSLESSSLPSFPARSVTNAKIACVVTGSSRPMTAASATLGCDTRADSTSVVEMRWPETFITSSTRPISQKYPSLSLLAPSPAKYFPG